MSRTDTNAASPRPELIDGLRARIANVTAPLRQAGAMPFGVDDLNARLGDHGICASALHEIAAAASSLADNTLAALLPAGIVARFTGSTASALWAVTRFDLYERASSKPDWAQRTSCPWRHARTGTCWRWWRTRYAKDRWRRSSAKCTART